MSSQSKTLITVIAVFILIAAGVAGYMLVSRWHQDEMNRAKQQSEAEHLAAMDKMEADMAKLQARLDRDRQAIPGTDTFPDVFGTSSPGPDPESATDCAKAEAEVRAFLSHLDAQPYMASRHLNVSSAEFFSTCAALLLADPPVNVAEMNDLHRLSKNMVHFYRVLGKDRLLLAKDILTNESAVLEPAMAVFYTHLVECGKSLSADAAPLSLEGLYEYAGYFLNTLGGRSYLMRRDPRVSTLVSYYAILVVDQANGEQLNPYGIDIRPHIDVIAATISTQSGLAYRDHYLDVLTHLKRKYN